MIINAQYHINVTLQILHKKGCISKTTAETCYKGSIWSVLYAPSFAYKEREICLGSYCTGINQLGKVLYADIYPLYISFY